MRRFAATALILGFVLAGCTSSAPRDEPDTEPPFTPSTSPSSIPVSDIQFLLEDSYSQGDRVAVKIKNVGNVTYRYQSVYQACFLSYFDSNGREFIIPPGTHCDILSWVPIRPGETKRLFMWDLDECTKDLWGCSRNRPLDPGTYTMQGAFRPLDEGSPARAGATFEITAAS
jgi:hypothetical protein